MEGKKIKRKKMKRKIKEKEKYDYLDVQNMRGKKSYILYKMTYISFINTNMFLNKIIYNI